MFVRLMVKLWRSSHPTKNDTSIYLYTFCTRMDQDEWYMYMYDIMNKKILIRLILLSETNKEIVHVLLFLKVDLLRQK